MGKRQGDGGRQGDKETRRQGDGGRQGDKETRRQRDKETGRAKRRKCAGLEISLSPCLLVSLSSAVSLSFPLVTEDQPNVEPKHTLADRPVPGRSRRRPALL